MRAAFSAVLEDTLAADAVTMAKVASIFLASPEATFSMKGSMAGPFARGFIGS